MSVTGCLIIGLSGGVISSTVAAVISDVHRNARDQAFSEQAIVAYSFAILGPVATGIFVSAGLAWRGSVIVGALAGVLLVVLFRNAPVPAGPTAAAARTAGARLPAAFWAYCVLLGTTCALEFSILLWGPAFLERVIGLSTAAAATGVAGFFIGVLSGRLALRFLVRRFAPRTILLWAYAIGVLGFALYWGVGQPWAAIVGIFMLGLCIAPQYPLTMALGLGIAGKGGDIAALRLTLAFGLSILIAPAALGALADVVGLRMAHLTLPALIAASLATFLTAGYLERRSS
jgi:fucose permease